MLLRTKKVKERTVKTLLCSIVFLSTILSGCSSNQATILKDESKKKEITVETAMQEPTQLDAPTITASYIDGKYWNVVWEPVDNANSYHLIIDAETEYDSPDTVVNILLYDESNQHDDKITLSIQADNSSSDYSISEPVTLSVYKPDYDFDMMSSFTEATNLSLDLLQNWADYHGYTYKISNDDSNSTVSLDIYMKDKDNSGFLYRLGRAATTAVGEVFETANEKVNEKTDGEIATDIIQNSIDEESLVEGFNRTASAYEEEYDFETKLRAGIGAFKGVFKDTDIHYIYTYPSDMTDYGCINLVLIEEKRGHEDLSDIMQETSLWTKIGEGIYSSNIELIEYGRILYCKVEEDDRNKRYPRWVITFYPSL